MYEYCALWQSPLMPEQKLANAESANVTLRGSGLSFSILMYDPVWNQA